MVTVDNGLLSLLFTSLLEHFAKDYCPVDFQWQLQPCPEAGFPDFTPTSEVSAVLG